MTTFVILISTLLLGCFCRGNEIPKFVPQGYHLDLFPDTNTGLLNGQICINIATFAEPTNVIELDADPSIIIHYKSIKVAEFVKNGQNHDNMTKFDVVAVERVLFEPGVLKIHLKQKLLRDIIYQVHVDFQTMLKNDSDGPFYMRTFFDHDTHLERKIMVMDLTKTGCYKAFPCFNKPELKSWVALTVIRKPNLYALSTAPVNYTTEIMNYSASLVKDYFLNTPPISMNSLALIVSDYRMINKLDSLKADQFLHQNWKEEIWKSFRPILTETVFTSLHSFSAARNVDDTLDSDTVNLILKRLEELLAVPFPLPSFDVVMVPKEARIPYINAFGLIVLNGTSSYVNHQQLMDLILGACYQWFFHVATPVHANSTIHSIIFNLRNIVAEEVMKNFKFHTANEFNQGQLLFINLEQIPTERLLSPHGTNEVLRTLTLSMLDRIFPGLLKEAMHILLHKKQFKMYTDGDIWNAMNEASRRKSNFIDNPKLETLEQIIDSWNKAEPIPLLNVRRDYTSIRVNISQEPFIYASYKHSLRQTRRNVTSYKAHWIPVVISQPSDNFKEPELLGWLSDKSQIFEINSNPYDFIIVNPSHLGPFVVNYDEQNWRILIKNFSSLPSSIKLQLLVDSVALANVGLLSYDVFLRMSTALMADEHHIYLWLEYYKLALKMHQRLHGGLAEKYKTFITLQVDALVAKITDEKLKSYSQLIQNMIKEMKYRINCLNNRSSCFTFFEYETLIHEAKMGRKLTGKHNCEIVRNVSLMDWEIIANGVFRILYTHNFTSSQKSRTLAILSCTEQPLAFQTYMNLVLLNFNKSGIAITENNQIYIIESLSYQQRPLFFTFLKKNFHMLKERLTEDVWATLIHSVIKLTRSSDDFDELLEFCSKFEYQFGSAEDVVNEGLTGVATEVGWESQVFPSFEDTLDQALKSFEVKNST